MNATNLLSAVLSLQREEIPGRPVNKSRGQASIEWIVNYEYNRGRVMLNIETKKLGTVAVLGLQGKIVIGQTEPLCNAIQSLNQVNSIKLDLTHVSMIDAHGLGVLLQLREQTLARGARFQLTNAGATLRDIMGLTRLDTVFQISSGVEVAAVVERAQLAA